MSNSTPRIGLESNDGISKECSSVNSLQKSFADLLEPKNQSSANLKQTAQSFLLMEYSRIPEFQECSKIQEHQKTDFQEEVTNVVEQLSHNNHLMFERVLLCKRMSNSQEIGILFQDFLSYLDIFHKNVFLKDGHSDLSMSVGQRILRSSHKNKQNHHQ